MEMHDPQLHPIGRRRDSRLRVSLPGKLETLSGTHRVALVDLSQSGAHVRTGTPIRAGSDAVLSWLHYEVIGKIIWSDAAQAGIEFDELLAPATLLTTRDIVDNKLGPDERREHYEASRRWYQGEI